MKNKKRTGTQPLLGRTPKRAEWRLLEALALDLKDHIDHNDLLVIRDICQKADIVRYSELSEYWGLHSIQPSVQPVGTRDACLYQLSSFLEKMQWDDDLSPHQVDAATAKFVEYEQRMRIYNRSGYRDLTFSNDPQVNVWLTRMQHFCRIVLGRLDLDVVQRYAKHGPGGTFELSSQMGHRFYKYASIPYETTQDAIHMVRRLILKDERWKRAVIYRCVVRRLVWQPRPLPVHKLQREPYDPRCFTKLPLPKNSILFRVVPGNRIEFVPKKESIARTIALEPMGNVMLQLGVDGYLRKRLAKFGININDQTINQRLARVGSIDNSLATLDLSGASDNISMRLVEKLLPYEWVEYLYRLRSDIGVFPDGTTVRYEKLSSMGNGYTFAIETLLFAAVVFAVNPEASFGHDAHVYGDDIIVKTSDSASVMRLLELCGYIINTDKSFFSTSFTRESCGADFYKGQNIRPVFMKSTLESMDVFSYYSLHNRLFEWGSRILHVSDLKACELLKSWCAPKWLLYGPPSMEDQSGYLAVPEPPYGRTPDGLFRHDRAVAVIEKFNDTPAEEYYFRVLSHSLGGVVHESPRLLAYLNAASAGSQFDVTRRTRYKIRVRSKAGRAFAWPTHHHAL